MAAYRAVVAEDYLDETPLDLAVRSDHAAVTELLQPLSLLSPLRTQEFDVTHKLNSLSFLAVRSGFRDVFRVMLRITCPIFDRSEMRETTAFIATQHGPADEAAFDANRANRRAYFPAPTSGVVQRAFGGSELGPRRFLGRANAAHPACRF